MPNNYYSSYAMNSSRSAAFIAATCGCLVAVGLMSRKASLQERDKNDIYFAQFKIPTDFMERISEKPYISDTQRIPERLRILSIDIPKMREAFDGDCRVVLSKIYPDGIAPSKIIKNENSNEMKIIQKSFARSFVTCQNRKKIGVELLEGSIANINPRNLRRTPYQFGKSIRGETGIDNTDESKRENLDRNNGEMTEQSTDGKSNKNESFSQGEQREETKRALARNMGHTIESSIIATDDMENDAPWNQYAWIEELQLRVQGKIKFGGILNPTSSITRFIFGNVYKAEIPSNRAWWDWFLPSIWHRDPSGVEGQGQENWASQKPHAIIADGAAMQRVPGSLRFLQKTCQRANVPLFIVNDPRVWGGNTHQQLHEALQDMRKIIKVKIVQEAIRGNSFARGRLLGQFETEAKWQARDMSRRTRQAIQDANHRLKKERVNDWSMLSAQELKHKFIQHKIIRESKELDGSYNYTNGIIELARQISGKSQAENNRETTVNKSKDSLPPVEKEG